MSSPGDILGHESCLDLRDTTSNDSYARSKSIQNQNPNSRPAVSISTNGHRSFTPAKAMKVKQMKEYPPPLPSLGMEMRRYCTNDGRLIIREEKTTRPVHDVFRADRSNGRLTLHLVRCSSLPNPNNEGFDQGSEDVFQMDDVVDTSSKSGVVVVEKIKRAMST